MMPTVWRVAALAGRPRSPQAEGMASLLTKLKPKRHWVQVSLRTVLVLVTALCVALSLWVVPAERQRRAVAAIDVLGGRVGYATYGHTKGEVFRIAARRWFPPAYLYEVWHVDLGGCSVSNDDLGLLQCLPHVEELHLSGTDVTDAGLVHFRGALKVLYLNGTRITDDGLADMRGLTCLRTVELNGTHITDAGVARLQGLTGLQRLVLDNTRVTDAGLAHLHQLTSLQQLSLNHTQVTDAGLVHVKGLMGLQWLFLDDTRVTNAGVTRLRQSLPNCIVVGP